MRSKMALHCRWRLPPLAFLLMMTVVGAALYRYTATLDILTRSKMLVPDQSLDNGNSRALPHEPTSASIDVIPYLAVSFTEYQRLLRQQGFESTAVHDFKSPYVVDPNVYKSDVTVVKPPGRRPTRIISCYNCAQWFIDEFRSSYNRDIKTCPYNECVFDAKGDNLTQADVVMFFPGVSKMPPRPLGQIWAFCGWESPVHYGYPRPYPQWKGVFNWTISYRLQADIFIPYNKMAWRAREALLPDSQYKLSAQAKTKTVAWFVSNCHTPSARMDYVKTMQEYVDVDIYGRCSKTKCGKSECLQLLNTTYKFYLSFENSICKDYATEKLFKIFADRMLVIPVVRGGFDYNQYLPPDTFIDASNFDSPKALALHLKSLSNDVDKYTEMLKQKDKMITVGFIDNWCSICQKLHLGVQPKTIDDIQKYSTENVCRHG